MREGYQPYPDCDDKRSGCKVGWRYYRDGDKANECAAAAKVNAAIDRGLGYDHGYCEPGSIMQIDKGERAGMFEVCIP